MKNNQHSKDNPRAGRTLINRLKTIGIAGFLFFFIKGLVWLGVFAYLASC